MAKNKQKQKGLLESVHDGYVRGSMGGEEDTSQARIVTYGLHRLKTISEKFLRLWCDCSQHFLLIYLFYL